MTKDDRKKAFVTALAHYLVDDAAKMSIRLQMGTDDAKHWAAIRGETPLRGWATFEEAEKQLMEWLL